MSISSSIINGIFQHRIPESPNPQNQDEVIDKKGKNWNPDQERMNCIRFEEMIRYADIRQEKRI